MPCQCRMCANLNAPTLHRIWDRPLLGSDHFVAIPSLGSLVRGWLLVVPRCHYLNLAKLPNEEGDPILVES